MSYWLAINIRKGLLSNAVGMHKVQSVLADTVAAAKTAMVNHSGPVSYKTKS